MSKLTFFKNYNNYYNRIVKDNEREYLTHYINTSFENINFNPSNGINTEQVINWNLDWTPDYMMVDLTKKYYNQNWMKYINAFYWMHSSSSYDIEVEGTNAEVLSTLSNYPVWDEDLEEYVYENYVLADNSGLDLNRIWMDWRGEINWNYYEFQIGFDYIPAEYFYMQVSGLSWGDPQYPHTYKYARVTVEAVNPDNTTILKTFNTYDIPNGKITYDYLHSIDSRITQSTKITWLTFDPNTQDDTTDSQYCPNALSVSESDYNEWESAWFVIDMERTRQGQYKLFLKRDFLADKYKDVLETPMIIDRAMLDETSSLLYNPEGFSFNQIKKDEILLKDNSNIPWYYLYFKKQPADGTESDYKKTGTVGIDANIPYDIAINTPISSSLYKAGTHSVVSNRKFTVRFFENYDSFWGAVNARRCIINVTNSTPVAEGYSGQNTNLIHFSNSNAKQLMEAALSNKYSTLCTQLDTQLGDVISDSNYRTIWNAQGKVIKDGDNRYWRVSVSEGGVQNVSNEMSGIVYQTVYSAMTNSSLHLANGSYRENQTEVSYTKSVLRVTLSEISPATVTWSVDFTSKWNTTDGDYNILAIPARSIGVITSNNPAMVQEDICKRVLDSMMRAFSSDILVDIQLLPYAPYQNVYSSETTPRIVLTNLEQDQVYFNSPVNNQSFIEFYVRECNFTFNITQPISMKLTDDNQAIRLKMDNECSLYRLCSPNYNGLFEFSVAKNGGSVDFFNVDMTLKPINPYIHINPNFKGMYGIDYDDSRGLICGGDFSIPKWSNAFVEYELNNKNYQQIFDRQLRHMDFTQRQEAIAQNVSMITGSLTAGAAGAGAGAMASGSPYGAIAGGVLGSAASIIGGTIDTAMMYRRHAEDKAMAMDTFTFQLGNIKALPLSVNKISPLTFNNKIFPFVEVYTCTDEEVELFRNYIKYKSMNVNTVGTILEYQKSDRTFIKGTPIRLENTDLTADELYEIFNELQKGVYI